MEVKKWVAGLLICAAAMFLGWVLDRSTSDPRVDTPTWLVVFISVMCIGGFLGFLILSVLMAVL